MRELFSLPMTHPGLDEMLCTASNLRPEGGCRSVCLSPLSASPGGKAVSCAPAGRICLARNRLGDWVLNRKVTPDDTNPGDSFMAKLGKGQIEKVTLS